MTGTDLHIDARLLVNVVNDLDKDVTAYSYDDDLSETLDSDLIAWAMLEEANRTLAIVRAELGKKLAGSIDGKRAVVEGAGVFEVHRKADRKSWDKDALLRSVLDTRRVDDETGEIESQLDKVLHVWNLPAPRITALKERGLDPDEFCEVEYGGLTLQFVGEIKEEAA